MLYIERKKQLLTGDVDMNFKTSHNSGSYFSKVSLNVVLSVVNLLLNERIYVEKLNDE